MRIYSKALSTAALLVTLGACHQAAAPHASAADIATAQEEAHEEVAKARAEAAKDIRSAVKTTGSDSRSVLEAKVTGSYDVAMVQADGNHKIATEKCLTLAPQAQPACNSQADADYEATKAAAKATRMARRQ